MRKISRRHALVRCGGLLAAGAAVATGIALSATGETSMRDSLRALLSDLETIDGDRMVAVHDERLEIAGQLRAIIGGAS